MATPLSCLRASERLLNAAAVMHQDTIGVMAENETQRLVQTFAGMRFDHEAATEVTEALSGESRVFNANQRGRMSAMVLKVMAGEAGLAATTRTYAEDQECLCSYNYYPDKIWLVLQSDDTLKNKMRHLSSFLIESLQLRNPNADTKRRIVATLHVASGMLERDPRDAYDDVVDFADIMKLKRTMHKAPQSLKVFPRDVSEFVVRYPTAYTVEDPPVPCRCNVAAILERSTKAVIPVRSSNAKVAKYQPTTLATASGAPVVQSMGLPLMMTMCKDMMEQFIHGKAPPDSASDIPGLTLLGNHRAARDRREVDEESPVGHRGRKAGGNAILAECLRASDVRSSSGSLAELQDGVRLSLQSSSSRRAGALNSVGALGVKLRTDNLDDHRADNPADATLRADELALAEPAGPTVKRRRVSSKTFPPWAVRASQPIRVGRDNAGGATLLKSDAVAKTQTKPMKKYTQTKPMQKYTQTKPMKKYKKEKCAKTPSTANPSPLAKTQQIASEDPTIEEVLSAAQSVWKFPKVLERLRQKTPLLTRPLAQKEASVKYHGGRLVWNEAKKQLRIFNRIGDKTEQRVSIKSWADMKEVDDAWALACSIIESDPRTYVDNRSSYVIA